MLYHVLPVHHVPPVLPGVKLGLGALLLLVQGSCILGEDVKAKPLIVPVNLRGVTHDVLG